MGRIDRAHGIGGAVMIRMVSNHPGRLDQGSELVAVGNAGTRHLVVTSAQPHQDRWLVHFDGIVDRESAVRLAGSLLHATPVTGDPDSYWVHELVGALVIDTTGAARGTVVQVIDNPASDILELDTGPLVPLRFATWDPTAPEGTRRLIVDGPDGLFGEM